MYFQFSLNNGSNPDICTSVKQNLNDKDTTDVDLVQFYDLEDYEKLTAK